MAERVCGFCSFLFFQMFIRALKGGKAAAAALAEFHSWELQPQERRWLLHPAWGSSPVPQSTSWVQRCPGHVLGTRSLNAGVLLPGAAWEGSAGAIGLGFIPQNSWSRCGYHGLL